MVKFDKIEKVWYNIPRGTIGYIICPCCHKQKLFRIEKENSISEIYIWCKFCKKEICLKSLEPNI